VELGLGGDTKKKLEWIDKVLEQGRPEARVVKVTELGPAVNEQEIAQSK
jgi:hypothetical protein